MNAIPRKEFAYRKSMIYKFQVSSAAQEAKISKMVGIILGKLGTFAVKPSSAKKTVEHIFAYGPTGLGSARLDLAPAVARATESSFDEILSAEAVAVRKHFIVIDITYIFSPERYDCVCRLFTQGRFKLYNPRVKGSKPLEIVLAPTLVELSHLVGTRMLKEMSITDGDSDGEEEEAVALDLNRPAIA